MEQDRGRAGRREGRGQNGRMGGREKRGRGDRERRVRRIE